jgi:prolyl oligopeptidase
LVTEHNALVVQAAASRTDVGVTLLGSIVFSLLLTAGTLASAAEPQADAVAQSSPALVTPAAKDVRLQYPTPPRGDQVDDYFGVQIADPYRPLEDPNRPATQSWVQAQNELTFAWLQLAPQRPAIGRRLERLWDFEKYGVPMHRGNTYLFTRNNGLQNQSTVYVTPSLDAAPRELLDPNKLSADGTVALSGLALSNDGTLLAYGLTSAGSDWQEWKVRDVSSGLDREDLLRWIKFSAASWAADGSGFYYSRFDEPTEDKRFTGINYYQKLYFHKLGAPQADDQLIYQRPDEKEWGFHGQVTDDGRYLVIEVTRGTEAKRQVFYRDLQEPDGKIVELITGWDANYDFVDNDGPVFWLLTDLDAPRNRLIAVDIRRPQRKDWRELIPQADAVLQKVSAVGERFLATYLRDAHAEVRTFDLDGKPLSETRLPGIGTVSGLSGRRQDTETFYAYTSFAVPQAIYRLNIAKNESSLFRAPRVDFCSDDYDTQQTFYTSRDGTRVPMFITFKKGMALDGRNPALLYGYGGFDVSLTPAFSVYRSVWLEMGGVFAMANLRGGGEYGRLWHEAGMKEHKQDVFDDFIAAAEYLIAHKFTTAPRLAISGGSNGGLLVAACLTQRPDLFGAALPSVGVLDMLRFQKFTIGWAWTNEYGSSDKRADFQWLYRYSPLHNIKPGMMYPATFIETGDHDDRVAPAHSFKFAATLQAAQSGPAPILIRIETRAGHGAGKPTAKLIESATDSLTFLAKVLGIETPSGW